MSNPTYFFQDCPTCGRRLQIRVEYLGRSLICRHCQGKLIAADPAARRDGQTPADMLRRADELLKTVARRTSQRHRCR